MIEGGCACGATRYVLDEAPRDLEDCHCEDCRRSAGGPFVTWGSVDRVQFRIVSGQLQRVSISGRFRHFASCCGSLILFEQRADALSIEVAIATLDDPAPYAPARIIWGGGPPAMGDPGFASPAVSTKLPASVGG